MYAIIETGGKQYKVQEGDVILVEKLDAQPGETVTFDRVLFVAKDGEVKAGNPTVSGARWSGTWWSTEKGARSSSSSTSRRRTTTASKGIASRTPRCASRRSTHDSRDGHP